MILAFILLDAQYEVAWELPRACIEFSENGSQVTTVKAPVAAFQMSKDRDIQSDPETNDFPVPIPQVSEFQTQIGRHITQPV